MPSPQGRRFPSRRLLVLALVVLLAPGCMSEEPDVATRPTPTPSAGEGTTPEAGSPGAGGRPDDAGARSSVAIRDEGDRRTLRGRAPAYVEIEEARVEGDPEVLSFAVVLAGKIPRRTTGDSLLRITFTLRTKDGSRYTFEAQCIPTGWGAFASGGADEDYLPKLAIEGSQVRLTVDRAYAPGLQAFDWLANVAWTKGETSYAFDAAPRDGFASFP